MMAVLARLLLAGIVVVLLFGTVMAGRMVHGLPGAAALRGLWLGVTRPWRIREVSPTGRLDQVAVWAIPAFALAFSRAIYTWFYAGSHLVLVLGAWFIAGLTMWLLTSGSNRFGLGAAFGGAAFLRTVILLVALATRGPGLYWYDFWVAPNIRFVYITVAFGAITGAIGLETAVTIWNDQMALLPWGLSRILGITAYLGIPQSLPEAITVIGNVLTVAGVIARTAGRNTPKTSH